jgi:hypothetical protein
MVNLNGFGDIVDDMKAKAQAYVGQMLIDRQVLQEIQSSSPQQATRDAASTLLETQGQLETQLGDVNTKINSGDMDVIDYASALSFFYSVSEHLNNVDALNKVYTAETGKSAGASATYLGISFETLAIVGAAVVVLGMGAYAYFKRR